MLDLKENQTKTRKEKQKVSLQNLCYEKCFLTVKSNVDKYQFENRFLFFEECFFKWKAKVEMRNSMMAQGVLFDIVKRE